MEESLSQVAARDYLDMRMADYVLAAGDKVKTADVAREVGEQIGASARLVRSALSHSARLLLDERRWDLRSRHAQRRFSVDGALRHILASVGRPLPLGQLARELALTRTGGDDLLRVVKTLVSTRPHYLLTADERVALRGWLLSLQPGDDDDAVQQHNFFGARLDLAAVIDQFDLPTAQSAATPLDGLVTLVTSVEEPVGLRLAMYVLWRARGEYFDSAALFEALLADPRVVLLDGPCVATPAYEQRLAAAIGELSAEHDSELSSSEPVDVQDILDGDVEVDEDFEMRAEDLTEVQRIISEAGRPLPLPGLVSDVFELFPGDLQYVAAVKAAADALRADDRFVELPDNRWHLRVLLPPTLYRVPVTLQLSPIVGMSLTGEQVDVALRDEGLEGGLEYEVRAFDLEDIGEEDEVPTPPAGMTLARRQRFVTSYRHFVSGTIKVRKIDRGVFPTEPPIRPITMRDRRTGEAFELWLNNQTGLLCGLDEWYKGRLSPAGHVFHIEWDEANDAWVAECEDEPDPFQEIPQHRLDELLVLRVRVEHAQDVSVLEIMKQLAEKHPAGVAFRRLYTECNIVRRIAKRQIASNLSRYPMFSLNDDETLWLYDERKSNRPPNPAKRAYEVGD
ncbi:MAG: hypothetical protein IT204_20550 [Fimbriimonadaceae bacterium]|nr:hypothetical protein [Fimbriimonadaceae bacterium]